MANEYTVNADGEILRNGAKIPESVVERLNYLEQCRVHHEKRRRKAEEELELALEVIDGVEAYFILKQRGVIIER